MPPVRTEMLKGKSPECKKAAVDCFHEGLVESIGIENRIENVRQSVNFLNKLAGG